jgi:hypothetical protein
MLHQKQSILYTGKNVDNMMTLICLCIKYKLQMPGTPSTMNLHNMQD